MYTEHSVNTIWSNKPMYVTCKPSILQNYQPTVTTLSRVHIAQGTLVTNSPLFSLLEMAKMKGF